MLGRKLIETVAAWSARPNAVVAKGPSREWKARIKAQVGGEGRRESSLRWWRWVVDGGAADMGDTAGREFFLAEAFENKLGAAVYILLSILAPRQATES